MIRTLIVDDHPLIREGLKQILAETSDIRVAGEAGTAAEAEALARAQPCDVIVLDIHLPDGGGLELLSQLRTIAPKTPVLMLSIHEDTGYAARFMRAGASGYIGKQSAREHLVAAIRKVAKGERYLSAAVAEEMAFTMFERDSRKPHETLSDREFQVFLLIAEGKAPRQIAEQLCLSTKTVATHRGRILEKMGLRNNAELVQYAMTHKLLVT
jgi:DNA-binding NarL/FixJ family response regulator